MKTHRVICSLPNASGEINGIAFVEDHGDMISEPIDQETAERFAAIPGYEAVPIAGASALDGVDDRTGDGVVTFADMKIPAVQALLANEPEQWEAVLSAESEARPGKERKGVMDAVEAAKARTAA